MSTQATERRPHKLQTPLSMLYRLKRLLAQGERITPDDIELVMKTIADMIPKSRHH